MRKESEGVKHRGVNDVIGMDHANADHKGMIALGSHNGGM